MEPILNRSPSPSYLPYIQTRMPIHITSERMPFKFQPKDNRLANSAKLRRQQSWSSQMTSLPANAPSSRASVRSKSSASSIPSTSISSSLLSLQAQNKLREPSSNSKVTGTSKLAWYSTNVLEPGDYTEKKERLLRTSKLKKDLEDYFDIPSPSWLAQREYIETNDSDYDTDLDEDLGLALIVDEKTQQIKEDGLFPEYKSLCRKYTTVPNSYFIRHAIDDELTMKHRYMSPGDCQAFGWEVENNLTFQKLDLEDNGIGPKHLLALSNMLIKNNFIQDVNLSNNRMGKMGARLAKTILSHNAHILKIDFSGNCFGVEGGKYIAEIIENNSHLEEFYLGRNQLEDKGGVFIGKALGGNRTLKVLDLSWNNLTKLSAINIANGLKMNKFLKTLNLSMNGIGNEGCAAILEALRTNSTLTDLDVSSNRLSDAVAEKISQTIMINRGLKTFKICFNNFTNEGSMAILKAFQIKKPAHFTSFSMEGIETNPEIVCTINDITKENTMDINFKRPSSRRERTWDPLCRCLVKLSKFLVSYDIEIKTLFPKLEKERNDSLDVYDIVELIKQTCEIERNQMVELRKSCRGARKRTFQLKEFEDIYSKVKVGLEPGDDSIQSAFSGKRRGIGAVDKPVEKKRTYFRPKRKFDEKATQLL